MSGEMAARALHQHFDTIRRAELTRLRKKVASLSAEQQAEIETITAQVVDAIARQPAKRLAVDGSPVLVRALIDLFHVA